MSHILKLLYESSKFVYTGVVAKFIICKKISSMLIFIVAFFLFPSLSYVLHILSNISKEQGF